jgi:hypothetical protein
MGYELGGGRELAPGIAHPIAFPTPAKVVDSLPRPSPPPYPIPRA